MKPSSTGSVATRQAGAQHRVRAQPTGSQPDHPDAGLSAGSDAAGLQPRLNWVLHRRCSRAVAPDPGARCRALSHAQPLRRIVGCRRTEPPRRWQRTTPTRCAIPCSARPMRCCSAFWRAWTGSLRPQTPTLKPAQCSSACRQGAYHPHRHQRTTSPLSAGERQARQRGSRRPCLIPGALRPTRACGRCSKPCGTEIPLVIAGTGELAGWSSESCPGRATKADLRGRGR